MRERRVIVWENEVESGVSGEVLGRKVSQGKVI